MRLIVDTFRDTGFYITDDQDRLMAFTWHNCEECNVQDESTVIGKTCAELFPLVLAEVYMKRDQEVRRTGKPIVNQVFSHGVDRSTDMRIVSVFPLKDARGRIIGTVCTYRSVSCGDSIPDWYGRIRSVVAHIDAHYHERIVLEDLAAIVGMSVTTFRRVFGEVMQTTPNRYLTTIRLNAARKLLVDSTKLIGIVAMLGRERRKTPVSEASSPRGRRPAGPLSTPRRETRRVRFCASVENRLSPTLRHYQQIPFCRSSRR